jgi:hypothetical protein
LAASRAIKASDIGHVPECGGAELVGLRESPSDHRRRIVDSDKGSIPVGEAGGQTCGLTQLMGLLSGLLAFWRTRSFEKIGCASRSFGTIDAPWFAPLKTETTRHKAIDTLPIGCVSE